jgi:hypothetical protein
MKILFFTILVLVSHLFVNGNTIGVSTELSSAENIIKHKDTIQYVRRILILGDSHFLGSFGEMFHRNLHETRQFDILSIAIGGAGSRNFTMTMRNNCCGYTIRESFHDEHILKSSRLRRIEGSNTLSGELVGKPYGGRVEKVVEHIDPHILIIALGHNYINDHQNLVDLIYSCNPNIHIVWVAPFRNRHINRQLHDINKVVTQSNIFLIRSDDIIGSDTAGCAHFYGKAAQNWANKVAERLQPLINKGMLAAQATQVEAAIYKFDTLPFFLRYADDRMFELFNTFEPNVLDLLSSLFPVDDFNFRPRYLNRMYSHFFKFENSSINATDFEGNSYKIKQIGNSFWMSENIKTMYLRNGSPIKQLRTEDPIYRNPYFIITESSTDLHYKYSWHTVSSDKRICPQGWHVPDISEWEYLKKHLDNPEEFFGIPNEANDEVLFWLSNKVNDNTSDAWAVGYSHSSRSYIMKNKTASSTLPVRCVMD